MKKYLFISNSTKPTYDLYMSKEKIKLTNVSAPCVEAAKSLGYEVFMGVNRYYAEEITPIDYNIKLYDANIFRSIFDFKNNYKAYKNLMSVIRKEKIDVIHCNTPIGGVLGRLCGQRANVPKIIYTAHGFHFYKGAPLVSKTIFKWAEKFMARYTDAIITINDEDYKAAQRFRLRNNGGLYCVPGVGIETSVIKNADSKREEILKDIGVNNDSILMISVGDLNKNKNNKVIIKALGELKNSNIHYILCGVGDKKEELYSLAQDYSVEKNVHFFGYRTDIKELLKSCDIFVMPSCREGLSRSLMEAMSAGLPCVVSKIRGNVDLIQDGVGGFLREPDDADGFAEAVNRLAEDECLRYKMRNNNLENIKKYDVENIKKEIKEIYNKELL